MKIHFRVRQNIFDIAVCILLGTIIAGLMIFPSESVSAAKDGLSLCGKVIIPSLFPFFVLSSMIVNMGYASALGKVFEPIMRPLFNVSGACSAAYVLGFIGGYPVGASSIITLYENGECSKTETERMLAFCNNSGPAFILGVVGAGVFASGKIGILLYLCHIAASVCVGIIFRSWHKNEKAGLNIDSKTVTKAKSGFAPSFIGSVKTSVSSILNICGFIVLFAVLIRLLYLSGLIPLISRSLSKVLSPVGVTQPAVEKLITGIIELSSGVSSLKPSAKEITVSVAMAAFMLGWAGVSVHCQVLSFIGNSGLSVKTYFLGKLLHGIISAVFAWIVTRFVSLEVPVSSYLARQVTDIAGHDPKTTYIVSLVTVVILIVICAIAEKAQIKAFENIKKDGQ